MIPNILRHYKACRISRDHRAQVAKNGLAPRGFLEPLGTSRWGSPLSGSRPQRISYCLEEVRVLISEH